MVTTQDDYQRRAALARQRGRVADRAKAITKEMANDPPNMEIAALQLVALDNELKALVLSLSEKLE